MQPEHRQQRQKPGRLPPPAALLGAVILLLAPAALTAQEAVPSAWDIAIGVCRDIPDRDARVACYDSLSDRMERAGAAPPASGVYSPRQQGGGMMTPEERAARLRQQQQAANRKRAPDREPESAALDAKQDFTDHIVALEPRPNGWRITLSNGQVWQQMLTKRYLLQEGHIVHIYPTIWGKSHRLSAANLGGFIQVKRLK